MLHLGNAGLRVLDFDLLVEFGRHALEIGNHHLDLRNLTALLVHLELFEPNEALAARFQDLYSLHIKSVPGPIRGPISLPHPPRPRSLRAFDSPRRYRSFLPAPAREKPRAQDRWRSRGPLSDLTLSGKPQAGSVPPCPNRWT